MVFDVLPQSVPDHSVTVLGGSIQAGVTLYPVPTTRLELAPASTWRVDRIVLVAGAQGWAAAVRQGAEGDAMGGGLLEGDVALARVVVRADTPFVTSDAIQREVGIHLPEARPAAAPAGVVLRAVVTGWGDVEFTVGTGTSRRTYKTVRFSTEDALAVGCTASADGFVAPADGLYAIHASIGMKRVGQSASDVRVARCQLRVLGVDGTPRDLAFSNAQADNGVTAVAVCHDIAQLAAGERLIAYAGADATLVTELAQSGGPISYLTVHRVG